MAWSDAARAAALETRRAHMKAKSISLMRASGHVVKPFDNPLNTWKRGKGGWERSSVTATKQWNAGRSFTSYANSKGQAMFMNNGVLSTSRAIRDSRKK